MGDFINSQYPGVGVAKKKQKKREEKCWRMSKRKVLEVPSLEMNIIWCAARVCVFWQHSA